MSTIRRYTNPHILYFYVKVSSGLPSIKRGDLTIEYYDLAKFLPKRDYVTFGYFVFAIARPPVCRLSVVYL